MVANGWYSAPPTSKSHVEVHHIRLCCVVIFYVICSFSHCTNFATLCPNLATIQLTCCVVPCFSYHIILCCFACLAESDVISYCIIYFGPQ